MSQWLSTSPATARLELSPEQWSFLHSKRSKQENALQTLSNWLKIHRDATRSMQQAQSMFVDWARPYVIGVAGSVSVGKSRFSRELLTVLEQWDERPDIQLVTTDSFLCSLETLREKGLVSRKGFPESYNRSMIFDFLQSVCLGRSYDVPIYCHRTYDVIAGHHRPVQGPDILILEGLDVCQIDKSATENIQDYVDFSIYLDAPEDLIKSWYVERFIRLRADALKDSESYFSRFRDLSMDQAKAVALERWAQINSVNLRENILPSRENADLIIEKAVDHSLVRFKLRDVSSQT